MGSLSDLIKAGKQPAAAPTPPQKKNDFSGLLGLANKPAPTTEALPIAPVSAVISKEEPEAPIIDLGITLPVEATQPTKTISADKFNHRDMVDGIPQDAQENFLNSVRTLYEAFDMPDLVSTACRNILLDLRMNEQLSALLHPEDIGQMVKFLRLHSGQVQASKLAAPKRATGGKKKEPVVDISSFLSDIKF